MRFVIGRLLAACVLLYASTAHSQTEPYTIETVLKLEGLGRASFDPTGRRAVFEHYRPYETATGFDNGYYTRFTRSELMISDGAGDVPARRLLPEAEGVGHMLGAWSPSGTRLLVFQFTGRLWQAGIYTVPTSAVVWLPVTPELPLYGPIAAWRGDDELILITRADGDLPWHLRMNWEPNVILSRLSAQQAAGQASAITVGSGASRGVISARAPGALVSIDARTGHVQSVAKGHFQDMELSPDGRYAAVADEGEVLPVDPERPIVQGELQRARALRIIDLDAAPEGERALAWEPAPGWDLLPNLLTWSEQGELLVWMRPSGVAWSKGALKSIAPRSRDIQDVAMDGATPMWDATSEKLPVVHAAWLGNSPVLFSKADGDRADWRLLTPDGAVILTSRLGTVPDRPVAINRDAMLMISAGVVWRIDVRGAAAPMSSPGQRLTEVRDDGRMFGLRPWFNDPMRRDWAIVRNEAGDVFRAVPERLEQIAGEVTSSIAAVAPDGLVQVSKTEAGVETLQRVSAEETSDLITINAALAYTRTAGVTPIFHAGPNGESLTSWLYAPPGASISPPPLVVILYPGMTYGVRPAMAEPETLMTSTNVQVLVGAGYAVLLPSLPRRAPDEAAAGLGAQIQNVIDAAALTRRFDPNCVVLWGHSFGGFGALVAATQTDRFKGVIGSNGVYDFASHWGSFTPFQRLSPSDLLSIYSNVGSVETAQGGMGGPPWEDPARYTRNSPFFSADKITAPVLLIASDLDYVPLSSAEMMFSALYRQNKDAVLVTYIGEGHVLTSPGNLRHLYAQVLSWLDRVLALPAPQWITDIESQRRTQASSIVNSMMSP